jgi:divalent metal cation (Fe/Co/Zn/Cd) transporter
MFRTRLLERQPSSSLYPVIRQVIQEDPAYSQVKLLRTRKDGKNFRVRVNYTWSFNFRIEGKAYLMKEITHHPK